MCRIVRVQNTPSRPSGCWILPRAVRLTIGFAKDQQIVTYAPAFPALFVVLWATGFIGARLGMPHAEPLAFLSLRFAIASGILLSLALLMGAQWPKGRHFLHSMVVGALLHGVYLGCVFWAIDHGMPAGLSAMIVGLQPLATAILAGFLLGENISLRHWIGLGVGLAGLGLVLLPKLDVIGSGVTSPNIIACAMAVLGATLGTVYQKRFVTDTDLRTGTCAQYVGAFIPCLIYALAYEGFEFDWNGELIFALAWLVLVLSIGAILLLMILIRQGSVARVASLFYLVPAVTALIAWPLFGETLLPVQIGGMVMCAAAVALATGGAVRSKK